MINSPLNLSLSLSIIQSIYMSFSASNERNDIILTLEIQSLSVHATHTTPTSKLKCFNRYSLVTYIKKKLLDDSRFKIINIIRRATDSKMCPINRRIY